MVQSCGTYEHLVSTAFKAWVRLTLPELLVMPSPNEAAQQSLQWLSKLAF